MITKMSWLPDVWIKPSILLYFVSEKPKTALIALFFSLAIFPYIWKQPS